MTKLPLFIFLLFCTSGLTFAQKTITVTGSAELVFPVTGVEINFRITIEAAKIPDAQQGLQKKITAIYSDLQKYYEAKNEDITQTAYSVKPDYQYVNQKSVFRAYVAEANFSYRHSLLSLQNEILNTLGKNGIVVEGIKLLSRQDSDVWEGAYKAAMSIARFVANAILENSGSSLGKVLKVDASNETNRSLYFSPEGPADAVGHIPPSYEDLKTLPGTYKTNRLEIVVTFEILN